VFAVHGAADEASPLDKQQQQQQNQQQQHQQQADIKSQSPQTKPKEQQARKLDEQPDASASAGEEQLW
jgi:hypothetical protein